MWRVAGTTAPPPIADGEPVAGKMRVSRLPVPGLVAPTMAQLVAVLGESELRHMAYAFSDAATDNGPERDVLLVKAMLVLSGFPAPTGKTVPQLTELLLRMGWRRVSVGVAPRVGHIWIEGEQCGFVRQTVVGTAGQAVEFVPFDGSDSSARRQLTAATTLLHYGCRACEKPAGEG